MDFTQKTKTCHIFLGSPVSYIEGPNWQILAQQVLKNKFLVTGFYCIEFMKGKLEHVCYIC